MHRTNEIVNNLKPYVAKYRRNPLPSDGPFDRPPLDAPSVTDAHQATYMRDDDYVIGVVYSSVARAYPTWIIDYYHVVNDTIQEEPLVVFS